MTEEQISKLRQAAIDAKTKTENETDGGPIWYVAVPYNQIFWLIERLAESDSARETARNAAELATAAYGERDRWKKRWKELDEEYAASQEANTNLRDKLAAARADRDKAKQHLKAISDALGWSTWPDQIIDVEHAAAWAKQHANGLLLMNVCAHVLKPPDDIGPGEFIPWCKSQADRIAADRADLAAAWRVLDDAQSIAFIGKTQELECAKALGIPSEAFGILRNRLRALSAALAAAEAKPEDQMAKYDGPAKQWSDAAVKEQRQRSIARFASKAPTQTTRYRPGSKALTPEGCDDCGPNWCHCLENVKPETPPAPSDTLEERA